MESILNKAMILASAAMLAGFCTSVLAGEFEGTWLLDDTSGKPFEAILAIDGTASGTHGDSMKHGYWIETDGAALIHWDTQWVTVIVKQGDHYMKQAYKPGASLADPPADTSRAKKKK